MKTKAILVHGAWADGSNWRKVIAALNSRGIDAQAAQIPLTSFADDVAALKRVVARHRHQPLAIVAHSYAGAVMTEAATHFANVRSLSYIAGYAPDANETVLDLRMKNPAHPDSPELKPDQDGFIWIDWDGITKGLAHDVTNQDEQRLILATQKPIALKCLQEVTTVPAWKSKPSWYLLCEQDRMLSIETQRFMAERISARTTSLGAGHHPLLSHPIEVADLIAQACSA